MNLISNSNSYNSRRFTFNNSTEKHGTRTRYHYKSVVRMSILVYARIKESNMHYTPTQMGSIRWTIYFTGGLHGFIRELSPIPDSQFNPIY